MNKRSLHLVLALAGLVVLAGLTLSLAYARGGQYLFQVDEPETVPASSFPAFLTDVDGILFFSADDGVHGSELWMTDGTPAGTRLVADIFPGPEGSYPTDLINVNGILFFSADDGAHGTELWMSDGTLGGTKLFADINPGVIELYPEETAVPAVSPEETVSPPASPQPTVSPQPTAAQSTTNVNRRLYVLEMGKHLYEEPWGGDRGDPCEAWRTGNFDDNDPNYRGFNLELKLTNNSTEKIPDDWAEDLTFWTESGKELTACYYGYEGMGPAPRGTTSVTFFTVVPRGDYVSEADVTINDEAIRLCFDGRGGVFECR